MSTLWNDHTWYNCFQFMPFKKIFWKRTETIVSIGCPVDTSIDAWLEYVGFNCIKKEMNEVRTIHDVSWKRNHVSSFSFSCFAQIVNQLDFYVIESTLGPRYEFGYYEHPAITSRFVSHKREGFWSTLMFEKVGYNE